MVIYLFFFRHDNVLGLGDDLEIVSLLGDKKSDHLKRLGRLGRKEGRKERGRKDSKAIPKDMTMLLGF
jgi:hypothetical protein